MLSNDQLTGCHVALITPMKPCGSLQVIDYEHVFRLIDRCLDGGVAGLLFAGTTGQSATLSHAEQIELCARGIEYARARAAALGRSVTCLASAGWSVISPSTPRLIIRDMLSLSLTVQA